MTKLEIFHNYSDKIRVSRGINIEFSLLSRLVPDSKDVKSRGLKYKEMTSINQCRFLCTFCALVVGKGVLVNIPLLEEKDTFRLKTGLLKGKKLKLII